MAAFVVTGGFGILGRAVANAAIGQGWKVALVDVSPKVPDDLAKIEAITCFAGVDLADQTAASVLFEAIDETFDGLGALANVAGGFDWISVAQADAAIWQRMMTINLLTTVSASRAALPALIKSHGNIVNVGAFAALKAAAGMAPYTAAKSGVHRLTESLAEELRPHGVRVNAVLPTIIDTPSNRRDMPDADWTNWIAPDDIAQVILFLASPLAGAVNGVLLPITK